MGGSHEHHASSRPSPRYLVSLCGGLAGSRGESRRCRRVAALASPGELEPCGKAGEDVGSAAPASVYYARYSGGNRAAGTPGYDRSAEYVAEKLKEAGYLVHFEEFEFPFFEERVPPVLLVSFPDGRQEPTPADAFRTLTNSGSSNVTAR